MKTDSLFNWLDKNAHKKRGKLLNQFVPVVVCAILLALFIGSSYLFIEKLINPISTEPIRIAVYPLDVAVGFFLYFITAIDYALIVGRMQVANPGAKSRFIMNVFTCLGCFVGVTLVLFLWGFSKEISWLIIPILIFAGSVMIKLAYEGREYFENSEMIPQVIRSLTLIILVFLYQPTKLFTFWMPELGTPNTPKMEISNLIKWSFLLPFIIGLDDLVGYMGAMTIYNVFSLLIGIYLADIIIDVLIFVSPGFTRKLVEHSILSLLAAYAFIYLAYKSFSEAILTLHSYYHIEYFQIGAVIVLFVLVVFITSFVQDLLKKQHE